MSIPCQKKEGHSKKVSEREEREREKGEKER
jgi:hypothetical protein